jgi:nitrogen regulatory protein PII
MKLIIALISPDRQEHLEAALAQIDAPVVYLSQVLDLTNKSTEKYRGVDYRLPQTKLRLEMLVVNEALLEELVATVAVAAFGHASERWMKGNILVVPVAEWIPVRGHEPRFLKAAVA